jgi:hypothetical protein
VAEVFPNPQASRPRRTVTAPVVASWGMHPPRALFHPAGAPAVPRLVHRRKPDRPSERLAVFAVAAVVDP